MTGTVDGALEQADGVVDHQPARGGIDHVDQPLRIDGDAGFMERANDTQVRESPGAAAREDQGHRVARERTRNARQVGIMTHPDMMMPCDAPDAEPVARAIRRLIRRMRKDKFDFSVVGACAGLREKPPFDFRQRGILRGIGQQHDLVGITLAHAVPRTRIGVGFQQEEIVGVFTGIERASISFHVLAVEPLPSGLGIKVKHGAEAQHVATQCLTEGSRVQTPVERNDHQGPCAGPARYVAAVARQARDDHPGDVRKDLGLSGDQCVDICAGQGSQCRIAYCRDGRGPARAGEQGNFADDVARLREGDNALAAFMVRDAYLQPAGKHDMQAIAGFALAIKRLTHPDANQRGAGEKG